MLLVQNGGTNFYWIGCSKCKFTNIDKYTDRTNKKIN